MPVSLSIYDFICFPHLLLPLNKIVEQIAEAADTNQKVQLASESTAEDKRDVNICQAEGKTNCEDNVCEIRNDVPEKSLQGGIQREANMQFEIVHQMSVPRDTEATLLGGCTENVRKSGIFVILYFPENV